MLSVARATPDSITAVDQDIREFYPVLGPINPIGIGTPFFDVGLPSKTVVAMLAGKVYLYVFTQIMYKDRSMPKDVYGITEACSYYFETFDFAHNCLSRSRLATRREIVSTMTEPQILNYIMSEFPTLGR